MLRMSHKVPGSRARDIKQRACNTFDVGTKDVVVREVRINTRCLSERCSEKLCFETFCANICSGSPNIVHDFSMQISFRI